MPTLISSVPVPANSGWKITNDHALQAALEDAAMRVVLDGGDQPLSEDGLLINLRTNEEIKQCLPAIYAPTVAFGDFQVVDRDEIEGYRSIYQLIRDYIQNKSEKSQPLSIAVFGPPGAGKSFGVKRVAAAVRREMAGGKESEKASLEFNLAQLSSQEDLPRALLKVANVSSGKEVPLVFFDEFDSSLDSRELGWLRYFLAPMQDGEFFFEQNSYNVGPAIFVFAGGTTATFRAFAREEPVNAQERAQWINAKGPDFISRLSGNVNVLGVNPRDQDDSSFLLRRAVVIRSELRKQGKLGRTGRALVDESFLKKVLRVGHYTHGARSLSMVLRMCVGENGILHLPPAEQLAMHMKNSDAENLLE